MNDRRLKTDRGFSYFCFGISHTDNNKSIKEEGITIKNNSEP